MKMRSIRRVLRASWGTGFALGLATSFGLPATAQAEPVLHWAGDAPCYSLFDTPVPQLPNGAPLTKILGDDPVQGHYRLPGGGVLRLSVRDVGTVEVRGDTFAAAYQDLLQRKPLQDSIARKASGRFVLADVRILLGASIRSSKMEDGSGYHIAPDDVSLRLSAKVRAANWAGYAGASDADRRAWDLHICQNYHHELGHILVAAQVMEASVPEWLALRGATAEDVTAAQQALMRQIVDRLVAAQTAYHDEIEEMGEAVADARPYLDLPFSWLAKLP